MLEPTSPRPAILEEPVQVAAVARVPPLRLQLIVAPPLLAFDCWIVGVGGGGLSGASDVPGLVG